MTQFKLFIVFLGLLFATFLASGEISGDLPGKRHDVVISFGSICCGPDMSVMMGIESLVGQYEDRLQGRIRVEKTYWGLEGETDYCIRFRGLAWRERHEFIREARAILKVSDPRTVLKQNSACGPAG